MKLLVTVGLIAAGLLSSARPSRAEAFTLSAAGTFTPIPFGTDSFGNPTSYYGTAYTGINDLGQVSGWNRYPAFGFTGSEHGFIYSNGVYSSIAGPDLGGGTDAYGITNGGQVVITAASGYYVFANGVYTPLNLPPRSRAYGISNSGDVVVDYHTNSSLYQLAFLYKNGVLISRPIPGGSSEFNDPYALGVNNADQIVGFGNSRGAFLYNNNNGTLTNIEVPGGYGTAPRGINDSGEIVGSYDGEHGSHGFTYQNGVYSSFDYPGTVGQTFGLGISDNGNILAETTVSLNLPQPQTPESSTILLMGLGLSCLAATALRSSHSRLTGHPPQSRADKTRGTG